MLKYYYDVLIDDLPILTPDAGVTVSREDIISDDSGYDELYVYHSRVVRSGVYKLEFSYSNLSEEDYRYLYYVLLGRNSGEFSCKFRYLFHGDQEITARCSKVSASLHNAETGHYKKLKITIQEC